MQMPPKIRPSAFWWKCAGCKAEMRIDKRALGERFCWGCDSVNPAQAQIALWGFQWEVVAWMALAMANDGVDWDNAEYVTSLLEDPITERWVGRDYYVPDRWLPKEDDDGEK